MKTINIQQGTNAWHQHRAQHFNASDAPAMLGCSPYKTRAQLVREFATGIGEEHDAATLQRFAEGHRAEDLARPLAEQIIGEELYPCVGVEGKYSASFDGLKLLEDEAFEHKALNDALRAAMVEGCTGADLPLQYQAQMEHQAMVSGASRVLFMASKWSGDELVEERHCWYTPNPELRARIVAGWEQFEADVAAYEPEPAKAAAVATPIAGFGALSVRVEGRVLASNLDAFKANADAFLKQLPKPQDLQTDQDFADADAAVRACSEAEARIKAAQEAALADMEDVDTLLRTAGSISEAIRAARLALEKAVKAEKDNRRAQIVDNGVKAVRDHYDAINATLGQHRIQPPQSLSMDIGLAIKGKKSLASMQDAVGTAAANAKIAASQAAERVRTNMALLDKHAAHASLFPDRVQLCASKDIEDLRNLVTTRITEHEANEEKKREEIRQEELAKLQAVAVPQPEPEPQAVPEPVAPASPGLGQKPAATYSAAVAQLVGASTPMRRLKLSEIQALIAPLSISANGLAELGFQPVAAERASKLYDAARLPAMVDAMQRRLALAVAKAAA
ncbi:YqaJ-like viral recombinase domain protein [Xanthomonas sp. GW]|uniref:lambda-exonuclease family protein n=1 Tax=Xanthomonas sp. GW TaxID=2724121 RepID=UPI0016395EDC|nr:YqaJ viral recombinase family protein [Xanthomonas sp. GW]QNH21205.1 YqaJ-like viral recombinase domain protein [Xanthomonas sp. GW]